MEPITTFTSRIVALPVDNIDTDQIIPARYLKTTSRAGLGAGLFTDWRYKDGEPNADFVLNRNDVEHGGVLVAGHNFGCGSSREHAPWALQDYGFRAVVSTDFADIFKNNSLKTGLLPIIVDDATRVELIADFDQSPDAEVTVDLENQTLTLPSGRSVSFPIDAFAKHCLLMGVDQMGFLLAADDDIAAYEASHPARVDTTLVGA